MDRVSDKEAKKKVESVYDAVNSSPVKSHMDLMDLENKILYSINALEVEITNKNNENIIILANSLQKAVNERNTRLKTLN